MMKLYSTAEKSKCHEKKQGVGKGIGFGRGSLGGIAEVVTSEERLEGREREPSRHLGGNVSGRENSQCKGPEAHELE